MERPQRNAGRRRAPAAGGGPDRRADRSLAEASALTGYSRFTLAAAAKVGNLEARKIGQQWVTTLAAVDAWRRGAGRRPGPRPRRKPRPPPPPAQLPLPEVGPKGPAARAA